MILDNRKEKLIEYYGGDELAASVLIDKYLMDDENFPADMWDRLATEISKIETEHELQTLYKDKFFDLLKDFKFIPGGRVMYAVGREEKVTTSNCYVIPIKEDSLEGIYTWLFESAMTYKSGGGVGVDISILRPRGTPVKGVGGVSPGAVSFMDLMSKSTQTVHQKSRRGALMISMDVRHPDILDFINIKSTPGLVEHANISVKITDDFMLALKAGEKYEQKWPVDSDKPQIKKRILAKRVWDEIIKNAHHGAEPGILFSDYHSVNDSLSYVNPALTVNPCGEIWLGPYGNCNLGHMNLAKYVVRFDQGGGPDPVEFDFNTFKKDVKTAVRFLDNMIDYNKGRHALEQQEETALKERRIGLGITGLGDCFIKLGIKYDSESALSIVEKIMECFRDSAYEASIELAEEREPFSVFEIGTWESSSEFVGRFIDNCDNEDIIKKLRRTGIRNSFLLTCAPVGSGSIVSQVSSGIEPLFATSYTRRVKQEDGTSFKEFKTYPKIIKDLFKGDENLPDYVVTAHNIDPNFRIKMQSIIQKYIDNSISSTINLDENVTEEVVSNIYMKAYEEKLKGITVYREGSRQGVLITEKKEEVKEKPKEDLNEMTRDRPGTLFGPTYKIPYSPEYNLYITINPHPDDPKRPYELLITSYTGTNPEIQTITVLVSALLKSVEDPKFIIDRLMRIESSAGPIFWHDKEAGRRHQINSVPKAVAIALEKFIDSTNGGPKNDLNDEGLEKCPKCNRIAWKFENGCGSCLNCGHAGCE